VRDKAGQGLEPRTRRLRVCCSARFPVPADAGTCHDVPGYAVPLKIQCRLVPAVTGPYRDIRANTEQTWHRWGPSSAATVRNRRCWRGRETDPNRHSESLLTHSGRPGVSTTVARIADRGMLMPAPGAFVPRAGERWWPDLRVASGRPHRAPGRYIADAQSSLVVRLTVDVPAIDLACTHMQIPGLCASTAGVSGRTPTSPKRRRSARCGRV
jgi:hypothetical protein